MVRLLPRILSWYGISDDLEQAGLGFARFLQEYEDTSDDDMNQAEAFRVTWEWKQETNMLDCDLCNAFFFQFLWNGTSTSHAA
jgi:hypothetical protein